MFFCIFSLLPILKKRQREKICVFSFLTAHTILQHAVLGIFFLLLRHFLKYPSQMHRLLTLYRFPSIFEGITMRYLNTSKSINRRSNFTKVLSEDLNHIKQKTRDVCISQTIAYKLAIKLHLSRTELNLDITVNMIVTMNKCGNLHQRGFLS